MKLTPRQQEVLGLIVQGLADKEIAASLGISFHTVREHVRNLYRLLGVTCRAACVAETLRLGLGQSLTPRYRDRAQIYPPQNRG